jgi:hypothetical protein
MNDCLQRRPRQEDGAGLQLGDMDGFAGVAKGLARVARPGVRAQMTRSRSLRSSGAMHVGVCLFRKVVGMRHWHLLREHGPKVTVLDLQASLCESEVDHRDLGVRTCDLGAGTQRIP